MIFIPQKGADRLKEYIRPEKIALNDRISPTCYEAARVVVRKAGNMVGIYWRPNDLGRHAATFASRSGVPIEIISKIILSMQIFQPLRFIPDLLATQRL